MNKTPDSSTVVLPQNDDSLFPQNESFDSFSDKQLDLSDKQLDLLDAQKKSLPDIPPMPPVLDEQLDLLSDDKQKSSDSQSESLLSRQPQQTTESFASTEVTIVSLSEPDESKILTFDSTELFSEQPEISDSLATGHLECEQTIISDAPPLEIQPPDSNIVQSTELATQPRSTLTDYALPIGSTLGHFSITKFIGGGGMGRVYEAVDLALDRKVAIKVLPRQRAQDNASVARFLNEAKSAARLNHEHIAQVYFCGEDNGIPYIAFEYVEGINIRSYVEKNGVIPLPEAINFILQITSAIAHASSHGVTHRDVKPSNILITPQGKAKLIDMGLARLLKPAAFEDDLTASGVTLGTFDYISPEQARDPRNADVRSDIYSLGCTFFFMLTGQPPFPEGTVLQKLLKHQGDEPPDLRTFAPNTPFEVSMVIQKMMAKNPNNRFQNPKVLINVLIEIAEMIGLQPPAPGQTVWSLPPQHQKSLLLRHFPWVISVLLLFLLTWGMEYFFIGQDSVTLPNIAFQPSSFVSQNESGKEVILPLINSTPTDSIINDSFSTPSNTNSTELALNPFIRFLSFSFLDESKKRYPGSWVSIDQNKASETFLSFSSKELQPERLAGGLDIEPLYSGNLLANLEPQIIPETFQKAKDLLTTPYLTHSFQLWFEPFSLSESTTAQPENSSGNAIPSGQTFIVDKTGTNEGTYASLSEAINAAVNASETNPSEAVSIELRFNGSLETGPLSISHRKIKITGAEGFQPCLTFLSNDSSNNGSEHLFLLNEADLELQNLAINFAVRGQEVIAREWSVFELFNKSRIVVSHSILTVENATSSSNFSPSHSNVAFFRNNSTIPDSNNLESNIPEEKANAPTLLIDHSLLRGEAVLFYCQKNASGIVNVDNSGLYTNGLLYYDDTNQNVVMTKPIEINVDNSIFLSRAALFRHFQSEENKGLLLININLTKSIIKLTDIPLGSTTSPQSLDFMIDQPQWNLEHSIFLNTEGRWRYRSRLQTINPQDISFISQTNRTLASLSLAANDEFETIAPHLFAPDDFFRLIFTPINNNGINSSNDYQTLTEIKNQLLQGLPFRSIKL
ncbi:MAG: serine/threonine-protein kinase [Planctomycetia bacterium]|nr:serine/threonine-protein kinase [Planctomycetia bacterium]